MKRTMSKTFVLLATILVLIASFAVMPAIQAQVPPTPVVACVTFTKDGETIGERFCSPNGANDMHLAFRGKCQMQFTKDGEDLGNPISCPGKGVNDFSLKWDATNGVITDFTWSKNGKDQGSEPVPAGANDCHFEAKKIVIFQWTQDGNRLGDPIPAPAGANDFECDIVTLPT